MTQVVCSPSLYPQNGLHWENWSSICLSTDADWDTTLYCHCWWWMSSFEAWLDLHQLPIPSHLGLTPRLVVVLSDLLVRIMTRYRKLMQVKSGLERIQWQTALDAQIQLKSHIRWKGLSKSPGVQVSTGRSQFKCSLCAWHFQWFQWHKEHGDHASYHRQSSLCGLSSHKC